MNNVFADIFKVVSFTEPNKKLLKMTELDCAVIRGRTPLIKGKLLLFYTYYLQLS